MFTYFREKGTWAKHKYEIEDCMYWVVNDSVEGFRGRQVVAQTTDWVWTGWTTSFNILKNKQIYLSILVQKNYQIGKKWSIYLLPVVNLAGEFEQKNLRNNLIWIVFYQNS